MIGRLKISTKPTAPALSLGSAKRHLGVYAPADDERVFEVVEQATDRVQGFTARQLATATYDYYLDQFPSGRRVELPLAPLVSVTSVKYQDLDDAQQTFSSSNYAVRAYDDEPGFVELDSDAQWASTYDKADAVVVRFVCGYGADETLVPAPLRSAIKLFAELEYDVAADRKKTEDAAERLMWPFRLAEVG
jgi:uncharacterized phiE125 gp8 family phage protein